MKAKIEGMALKFQQLQLNSKEITYKHDKLKSEKERFEQMRTNLEAHKAKLLEQN